jgi:bifunctional DNA-binding transcriptional regulator/antitoxin component of YhaV-PrlF toxin-antitoxin module
MAVTYDTLAIPSGNHASIAIPDAVLAELGANRRAPLRVTVNGHSYQSTATAVDGECRVVFPSAEREAAGVRGGDTITVTLELDLGHREVALHPDLDQALVTNGLREYFETMAYSHRKEYARAVSEAKADETRARRVQSAIDKIRERRDTGK